MNRKLPLKVQFHEREVVIFWSFQVAEVENIQESRVGQRQKLTDVNAAHSATFLPPIIYQQNNFGK